MQYLCEAEVAEGLEEYALDELAERFPQTVRFHGQSGKGSVRFSYNGDLRLLERLRTIEAVFLVQSYAVPRPKALLSDANFRLFIAQIETVQNLYKGEFQTLYLSAAGSESSIMTRIKQEVSQRTRLEVAPDKGDLLLRIRPAPEGEGWETLVRLTPRPLVTRFWRVCNYEGALNATVAHAMILMTQPSSQDVFVNLGAGSGTFLIERLAAKNARQVIGIENSLEQLDCARTNIEASGKRSKQITLIEGDMTRTSLAPNSADALCIDLPFGQKVGSSQNNRHLYPKVLAEAYRIAKPGAFFTVITHEIKLIETLLAESNQWITEKMLRVTLRGLHPRIYVLRKQSE